MQVRASTFIINYKDDKPESITCKICNMTSYNPNDIEHRYCGMCNEFHDNYFMRTMLMQKQVEVKKQAKAKAEKRANTRIFFITAFALMVIALILGFIRMAINNTGIVAKFGVWPAAAICVATAIAGAFIGFVITKRLKSKENA